MLSDMPGTPTPAYKLEVGDHFTYSGDGYAVLYRVYEHTYDPYGFPGVRVTYTRDDLGTGHKGFDGRIDVRKVFSK